MWNHSLLMLYARGDSAIAVGYVHRKPLRWTTFLIKSGRHLPFLPFPSVFPIDKPRLMWHTLGNADLIPRQKPVCAGFLAQIPDVFSASLINLLESAKERQASYGAHHHTSSRRGYLHPGRADGPPRATDPVRKTIPRQRQTATGSSLNCRRTFSRILRKTRRTARRVPESTRTKWSTYRPLPSSATPST